MYVRVQRNVLLIYAQTQSARFRARPITVGPDACQKGPYGQITTQRNPNTRPIFHRLRQCVVARLLMSIQSLVDPGAHRWFLGSRSSPKPLLVPYSCPIEEGLAPLGDLGVLSSTRIQKMGRFCRTLAVCGVIMIRGPPALARLATNAKNGGQATLGSSVPAEL